MIILISWSISQWVWWVVDSMIFIYFLINFFFSFIIQYLVDNELNFVFCFSFVFYKIILIS
jgi:hypothetical protein